VTTAAAKRATDPPVSVVVPLLQEFPAAIERLGTKLDDLTREVIRAQQGIERLVTIEDERRVAERQMEALAVALTPELGATSSDVTYEDWYRDADGTYRVRLVDGTSRPMTPEEIKAVTTPSRQR
jgi:single-stranded DNA-specific DHH superfamily exonuclease